MKLFDRFKRRDPASADPAAEADRVEQDAPGQPDRVEPDLTGRTNRTMQDGPNEGADREIPSVNARKRGGKVTSILGMAFIGAMGLYLIYSLNSGESRKDKMEAEREKEIAKANAVSGSLPPITVPPRPPEPVLYTPENQGSGFQNASGPGSAEELAAAAAGEKPPPPADINGPNNQAGQGANPNANQGPPPLKPWEVIRNRRRSSSITATLESEAVAAGAGQAADAPAGAQAAAYQVSGSSGQQAAFEAPGGSSGGAMDSGGLSSIPPARPDALSSSLQPTITTGTAATKLADLNYMITKGAFMDCVLETKIDSSVPGMTTCVLSRPMYSANRKLVLLDAGSKVVGQYSGGLQQGQVRIFVLWTRIETPKGVIINLDSPGTDPLGASGLDGHIDTKFWQRFGGAIMLSLIDDTFAVASQRAQNSDSGTTINLGNTQAASQNMAAEALKSSINIPPVLRKNHGDQINIFVARDLDFRSVYAIRAK